MSSNLQLKESHRNPLHLYSGGYLYILFFFKRQTVKVFTSTVDNLITMFRYTYARISSKFRRAQRVPNPYFLFFINNKRKNSSLSRVAVFKKNSTKRVFQKSSAGHISKVVYKLYSRRNNRRKNKQQQYNARTRVLKKEKSHRSFLSLSRENRRLFVPSTLYCREYIALRFSCSYIVYIYR